MTVFNVSVNITDVGKEGLRVLCLKIKFATQIKGKLVFIEPIVEH